MIKSPYDDREYDADIISNNKLRVLLISDPLVATTSVAMIVNVGYLQDTLNGMAHFLEHMLFMGTKSHPKEHYFNEFILKHGGSTNAFTAHDNTCYYYSIQQYALLESLEIFSHFFIDPLLDKSSVEREMSAVNSEHEKNRNDDGWRHEDIIKVLCHPDHSYKKFGTGSYDTLKVPNIDVHVRQFYDDYYSAENMTLMIICNQSIKEIKKPVFECFKHIRTNPLNTICPRDGTRISGPILKSNAIIKVVPIKNIERIVMYWETFSFNDNIKSSPIDFFLYLLGHEGKNSLQYVLTQNGYISGLFVDVADSVNDRSLIRVSMTLTSNGANNQNIVINSVYAYIDLITSQLNSNQMMNLYNEYMELEKLQYTYKRKMNGETTIMTLVKTYITYNVKLSEILAFKTLSFSFEKIKHNMEKLLNQIKPELCTFVLSSQKYTNIANQIASHYGTKYVIEHTNIPYDKNILKSVLHCFELPPKNKYIPSSFDLVKGNVTSVPAPLYDDKCEVYWKYDTSFKLPTTSIIARIDIPWVMKTVKTYVASLIYFNGIMDMINHELYLCNMAGYIVSVSMKDNILYVSIDGYSDKIKNVCDFVINSIINSKLDEISFKSAKFYLEKNDENSIHKSPYITVNEIMSKHALLKYYDSNDRLEIINKITKQDIDTILNEILTISSVKLMVCGNVIKEDITEIKNMFKKFIPSYMYVPSLIDSDKVMTIISAIPPVIKPTNTHYEKNVAMVYCIELCKLKIGVTENWNKIFCIISLLDNMIGDKYFDALRTREEFGYIVNGKSKQMGDPRFYTYYYKFLVQSPIKTPSEIITRTELFIEEYEKILMSTTDNEIQEYIQGCASSFKFPFTNLSELTSYYFSQFEQDYYKFDLKQVLIKTYEKITKADIVNFYKNTFMENKKSIIFAIDRL